MHCSILEGDDEFGEFNDADEGDTSNGGGAQNDSSCDGQGVAVVVDSEVTGYLMMGALSPGLKRNSVSLFEGQHRPEATRSSGICNA